MRGDAMNFKNISLFSLLLVAGFAGTVAQAYKVELSAQRRGNYTNLEYNARKEELVAAQQCLKRYMALKKMVLQECSKVKGEHEEEFLEETLSENDIEACMYNKELTGIVKGLKNRVAAVQELHDSLLAVIPESDYEPAI
jgi:hypothetical protein